MQLGVKGGGVSRRLGGEFTLGLEALGWSLCPQIAVSEGPRRNLNWTLEPPRGLGVWFCWFCLSREC